MKIISLVSVVVTTKNEEVNIGRFLESVKNQSYKNIEIIVVDNFSTDKTMEIAQRYTNKIFSFGPERSNQRNYGAKKSKGQYLVFLDADMELTKEVIKDCLQTVIKSQKQILVIPETTVGGSFLARIRKFEREMYAYEDNFEVPRFFKRDIFLKYGGYDPDLTGPEDYDLPFRIKEKYLIGRSNEYVYHHEEGLTLSKLLTKKFYYAKKGAKYAFKHPKLIWVQGTIIFRKVYLKNWKKFLRNPVLGISFIFVRFFETIWAVSGFIAAVGLKNFIKILFYSLKAK